MERLKLAPSRSRRIRQVIMDRPCARDRYDRWLVDALLDPVIMRRPRDPAHERAGRRGYGGVRREVFAARHIPCAGQHHAEPVCLIPVRRAHVAGMPADQDEILPGRIDRSEHRGRFRHARREIVERLPRNFLRPLDDGHGWVDAGRAARANAERYCSQRDYWAEDEIAPVGFDVCHHVLQLLFASLAGTPEQYRRFYGPSRTPPSRRVLIPSALAESVDWSHLAAFPNAPPAAAIHSDRLTEGFRRPALCRRAGLGSGPASESLVRRKPRAGKGAVG